MKDLDTMATIMAEKEKEIQRAEQLPLDAEGRKLAEGKRITFDVIAIPADPLR